MLPMTAKLPEGLAAWISLGTLSLDARGELVFPAAPERPGFYRFVVVHGGRPIGAYIGETGNRRGLRGRFRHYRQRGIRPLVPPGTTSNIAARFKAALVALDVVRVDILAEVANGTVAAPIDATTKAARLSVEADLVRELRASGVPVINK